MILPSIDGDVLDKTIDVKECQGRRACREILSSVMCETARKMMDGAPRFPAKQTTASNLFHHPSSSSDAMDDGWSPSP